jgi:hypothetical protein
VHVTRTRHAPADDAQALAESYRLLRPLCAEGFAGCKEVDGFEPVGLALPVLAVDDVETLAPEDFAAQIPEIVSLNRFEQHTLNFNIRCSNRARDCGF